jgi:hypothetical protein
MIPLNIGSSKKHLSKILFTQQISGTGTLIIDVINLRRFSPGGTKQSTVVDDEKGP